MIKGQVSHYKILKQLGAGGMGEVYLAEDTRLFRQVALKFLPASYQYDPERRARFLKEAQAASALRTPFAAAIHDIGEYEGLSFIVMEYVDGELLSRKIRHGMIPEQEVIHIAMQLAEALDEAHQLGIIHRDIKSNNVIITRRRLVKLLDFGLAQIANPGASEKNRHLTTTLEPGERKNPFLSEPPDSSVASEGDTGPTVALIDAMPEPASALTESSPTVLLRDDQSSAHRPWQEATTGIPREAGSIDGSISSSPATTIGRVMGTVPYMSPEQALGRPLDPRTDIFSLGVVLYEMLTGRLPFSGQSEVEMIEMIVSREPASIGRWRPDISEALIRVTEKCLAKNRDQRFATASDLAQELRALEKPTNNLPSKVSEGKPSPSVKKSGPRRPVDSIAVLPFENSSGREEAEYLSDGITESIINLLSQATKLKVMARSTVFRYMGWGGEATTVGAELGVRAVLTGRVLQRGDTLTIKTELVDTNDGSQLWGEQFNRKIFDIFAVEEEISREIADRLKVKLSGEQKRRLVKRHTENTLAYQEYLKGRYLWNKRTREGLVQSISHFNRAIDIDPNYALAYAGLADTYNIIASYSSSPPAEAFPKARSAATRALALDPALAEAHTALAFVRFGFDWDWKEAEREYRLALTLNDGYAPAHLWHALMLVAMGRHQEARSEMQQALELDPLSLAINTNWGWLLYLGRDFDAAIEHLVKTLEMEPNFVLAHRRLAQAYTQNGLYPEAEREYEKARALAGEDTETLASYGYFCAVAGRPEQASRALEDLSAISCHRYVPAYFFAKIYTGLGNVDRAFKFFEMALEERYGFLTYMKVEPEMDSLRRDPRFAELSTRIGLD